MASKALPARWFARRHRYSISEALRWFAAFLSVSFAARLYTLYTIHTVDAGYWRYDMTLLRGFASDIICCACIAISCVFILRFRLLTMLTALAWCYLSAGNYAHIIANNTNISYMNLPSAMQKQFLLGSAFSTGVLTGFLCACLLLALVLRLLAPRRLPLAVYRYAVLLPCIDLLAAVATFCILSAPVACNWLSCHPVENNLNDALVTTPAIPTLRRDQLSDYLKPDVSGTPVFKPQTPSTPNILLLIIEGLSANMLDKGLTPNLARLKTQSLYFENFILNSDRTINGLYSMWCGDYPRLFNTTTYYGTTAASKVGWLNHELYCLPRMLRKHGYGTVFLRPATLEFDNQGYFNRLIGFQKQYWGDAFEKGAVDNGRWGPNDEALFKQVEVEIGRQPPDKPWFIAALTVGTHHPYLLPGKYRDDIDYDHYPSSRAEREASFTFMDKHLGAFLEGIRDILDHTLVIVTSDETLADNVTQNGRLNSNRGFMMILTPDRRQAVVHEPFTQTDTFMSIADYIGDDGSDISHGRSLFRHYDDFRPVAFGTIYGTVIRGIVRKDRLLECQRPDPASCKAYVTNTDHLFTSPLSPSPLDPGEAQRFMSKVYSLNSELFAIPYPPTRPPIQVLQK